MIVGLDISIIEINHSMIPLKYKIEYERGFYLSGIIYSVYKINNKKISIYFQYIQANLFYH